jgi:hypothetical protein
MSTRQPFWYPANNQVFGFIQSRYSGYRFPAEIISYAVWAYTRQWCKKFGPPMLGN